MKRRRRLRGQKSLPLKPRFGHGGARKNAGPKRRTEKGWHRQSHRPRPRVDPRYPIHVTSKLKPDVKVGLRSRGVFAAVGRALEAGAERFGFTLHEYSVMGNHLHLIVEAKDAEALSRGMQGLKIRVARAVNRVTGRRGSIFYDRYHAVPLRSPTQVRNALAYVLNNRRRHRPQGLSRGWLDPFSSAYQFDGWRPDSRPREGLKARTLPRPRTWMLAVGWRRLGLLGSWEVGKKPQPG